MNIGAIGRTLETFRARLLSAEERFAPRESQRVLAVTILIGLVCGVVAVAFHVSIEVLERVLTPRPDAGPGRTWMMWVVLTPTLGALACGVLLEYVAPRARGSGVPEVKVALARGERVPLRDALGKFFIAALQLGSGASLGREGPTVQICAGVATALGRVARISPRNHRRMLPVGAAAGIAAAFNAPLAAVTFTIEEVVGTLDQSVLSGVVVAAALAAVVERSVLGTHPVFDVPSGYSLEDWRSLVLYGGLGVAAALTSVAFTDSLLRLRHALRKTRIAPWLRPAIGGAVTGAAALAVLVGVGAGGVAGGGYDVVERALYGAMPVRVLLVLAAAKLVATVFSYSSGGAGGIFAPTLFIGAMVGGAFGSLDATLFGHGIKTLGAFALVGMGAVFSGVIRAPITSVLIIVEMTSGYGLILPLMIANMASYIIARRLRPLPIYDALLEQDGIHLRAHVPAPRRHASAHVLHAGDFVAFTAGASIDDVLRAFDDAHPQEVYPVVDEAARLVGVITRAKLEQLRHGAPAPGARCAGDVMVAPIAASTQDELGTALQRLRTEQLRTIPVIDAGGCVVGTLDDRVIGAPALPRSLRD